MQRFRVLVPFLALFVLFLPSVAFAAEATFFGPIIPQECYCEGSAPDWGCVLAVVQNGINFVVSMGVVIFTLAIAYAGAMYMASATNPGKHKEARQMVVNILLGLFTVLSAWLVVDFVMKVLYNPQAGNFGPWESILADGDERYCLAVTDTAIIPQDGTKAPEGENPGTGQTGEEPVDGETMTHSCTGTASSGAQRGTPKQDLSCENCTRLQEVTCKSTNSCYLSGSTASKVESIEFSDGWRVTEAFPPTTCGHGNSCHYDGTCIDAGFTDGNYTATRVNAFIEAVRSAGLSPVMEVTSVSACNALKNAGVPERYLDVVEHATAAHFSVYNRSLSAQPGCQ